MDLDYFLVERGFVVWLSSNPCIKKVLIKTIYWEFLDLQGFQNICVAKPLRDQLSKLGSRHNLLIDIAQLLVIYNFRK